MKFIGSGVIHGLLLELTKNDQMEQLEVVVVVAEEGVETLNLLLP